MALRLLSPSCSRPAPVHGGAVRPARCLPALLHGGTTGGDSSVASSSGRRCVAAFAATSNPAFTMGRVQESLYEAPGRRGSGGVMTTEGAVQKTGIMLGVAVLGASYSWMQILSGNAAAAMAALQLSKAAGVVGLISAFATMFKPMWSPTTGLIYAASKGVALGAFSAVMEMRYPGIAINAAMITLGVAASLLVAFQSGVLRVTDNFRNGVALVTGGFMFCYLGMWIASMFGVQLAGILSGGPIGIGLCLLSAGLAASNILIDFDMIRSTARRGMPKWFEWYSGFSLMVSLVWAYTEILRLLAMLAGGGRDD